MAFLIEKDPHQLCFAFSFDLMKKFELCFSFPDDEHHYLIPELLNIQEPTQAAGIDPDKSLNFVYKYDVLPEGLLPDS